MAPRLILLMSTGSKKKEPRYVCVREARASHSHRMWAEVSSSAPHLLRSGMSDSPIRWRCLLRVLCPVRRPVTALDFVLLKDRNLALARRQGPEINSRVCLWVLPRTRHYIQYWLNNQRQISLLISCLETPKAGSGPTNFRAEPPLASSSAISFPRNPACPGTQYSHIACGYTDSYAAAKHCSCFPKLVHTCNRAQGTTGPWLDRGRPCIVNPPNLTTQQLFEPEISNSVLQWLWNDVSWRLSSAYGCVN